MPFTVDFSGAGSVISFSLMNIFISTCMYIPIELDPVTVEIIIELLLESLRIAQFR